jgi:hypothetical protein
MRPSTTFIPKRPMRRRKRRLGAGTGGAAGVLITSVEHQTIREEVIIRFSGPITWNGVDQPTAFEATTDDGPDQPCLDVLATGADWIRVEFNGGVDVGAAWALVGPMAGISPVIAWPQSGMVS